MSMRNWLEAPPDVHHNIAIVWSLFRAQGTEGFGEKETLLRAMNGLTRHMAQPGMATEYHDHDDKEQLYYIIHGCGKIKSTAKCAPSGKVTPSICRRR